MSIASETTRLKNAKAAIKTTIEGNGVTVPDETLLDGMASRIEYISTNIIDRSIMKISNNNVQYVGTYAFHGCKNLTTVNFPAVTRINVYAFQDCSSLTTLNFPAVTYIGYYAFSGCKKLTTADFPLISIITESVFRNCSSLTTLNFPAVTDIRAGAFSNCSSLTIVNFPVVKTIDSSAFNNCSSLTTANFPAVTNIKNAAFNNCSSLTALILRSETMAVLEYTNVFNGTPIYSGTGYIYVPAALIDSYKTATNWTQYADQFRAIEDYPDICGGAE